MTQSSRVMLVTDGAFSDGSKSLWLSVTTHRPLKFVSLVSAIRVGIFYARHIDRRLTAKLNLFTDDRFETENL
jgi:hypothetical protein